MYTISDVLLVSDYAAFEAVGEKSCNGGVYWFFADGDELATVLGKYIYIYIYGNLVFVVGVVCGIMYEGAFVIGEQWLRFLLDVSLRVGSFCCS